MLLFNGISKKYLLIKSVQSPFFAPLKRSYEDIDHRLLRTERGPRVLPVTVHMEYDNLSHFERLKEDVAWWLVHDKPKKLEFYNDPDRLYWAVVDSSVEYGDILPTAATATIPFLCGYKYSHERKLTINDKLTSNIDGHKSTPWKTKTTFSEKQTGYELQFNSPGKSDLRDINKIKLNYEFVAGDVLEIDYSKRKVTVNGVDRSNILSILQSNYMELPIGEVQFSVSHKTEFYYNERYY